MLQEPSFWPQQTCLRTKVMRLWALSDLCSPVKNEECFATFPAVRYGRVPKRSRERGCSSGAGDDGGPVSPSQPEARDLESQQLAMYDIILTISQAHHAHCSYTEEKTRSLARRPFVSPSRKSGGRSTASMGGPLISPRAGTMGVHKNEERRQLCAFPLL